MGIIKEFEEGLEKKQYDFDEDDKEVLKNTKEFQEASEKIRRLF